MEVRSARHRSGAAYCGVLAGRGAGYHRHMVRLVRCHCSIAVDRVGQLERDLGLDDPGSVGPLPITSPRMSHMVDALGPGYRAGELSVQSRRRALKVAGCRA
jgi:hypothetical protein